MLSTGPCSRHVAPAVFRAVSPVCVLVAVTPIKLSAIFLWESREEALRLVHKYVEACQVCRSFLLPKIGLDFSKRK